MADTTETLFKINKTMEDLGKAVIANTNFAADQRSLNQTMMEQMQVITEKITRMNTGAGTAPSSSTTSGVFPGNATNPTGEMKALHTLRSGTKYADPPLPEEENPAVAIGGRASEQQTTISLPASQPAGAGF